MGITLDDQELDEFLNNGHTLILTTVDKDGFPHSTPVWYVYMDGHLHARGRTQSQKHQNILRNGKVCGLVETGDLWRELKAVMIRGTVELVEDADVQRRYDELLDAKYRAFRETRAAMPSATRKHYSAAKVYWKIVPEKRTATWDNAKIRGLAPRPAS